MAQILSGKEVAKALTLQLKEETEKLKASGVMPCLAIVRVGERGDDLAYERGAVKRCQSVGIEIKHFVLPADASQDDLMKTVELVNADGTIHGCLIFMPLPAQMDETAVRAALLPEKDVDGITPGSQAGVYTGRDIGYPPCTPAACMEILKYYKVALKGASAVVLGRSLVVGRPLAMMLLRENATVTLCHSKTRDIASVARGADILAAAMGRAGAVTADFATPNQVIVDVGINVTSEGKLTGDVAAEAAEASKAYTPVPGGVGAVTTTVLAKHVIEAAKLAAKR
ncbi:MAG: bifunctional 5,10-methylenetetrahydrofolate dehydrogenase/5,10-methenyltetrahydrofolate cyclohydrolase [Pyramidobacter sp.]